MYWNFPLPLNTMQTLYETLPIIDWNQKAVNRKVMVSRSDSTLPNTIQNNNTSAWTILKVKLTHTNSPSNTDRVADCQWPCRNEPHLSPTSRSAKGCFPPFPFKPVNIVLTRYHCNPLPHSRGPTIKPSAHRHRKYGPAVSDSRAPNTGRDPQWAKAITGIKGYSIYWPICRAVHCGKGGGGRGFRLEGCAIMITTLPWEWERDESAWPVSLKVGGGENWGIIRWGWECRVEWKGYKDGCKPKGHLADSGEIDPQTSVRPP